MKTANEFYEECLGGFVGVAQRFGYANGGAQRDVVLMKRAEQAVREILKIKPLIKMFGNDPTMYYYQVAGFAFAMGVTLAMLKANAPEKFTDRNLVQMIAHDPETSPHELAFTVLRQFGMDLGIYNQLVQELYARFQELTAPYGQAKEPRDYSLAAFYATFMTGCSIALEKFAEKRAQQSAASAAPAGEKAAPAKKPAAKKTATKKPATKKSAAKRRAAAD